MPADSMHPRWLQQLHQVLTKVRLPVRDMVLAEGLLSLDLASNGEPPIEAQVRLREQAAHGFATTRKYVVAYQGRGELRPSQRVLLERFTNVLRRIETRLPADLDGVGAVFVTPSTPQHRFLRLFPFCTVERSEAASESITEVLVRTTSACNQSCPFCTGPEHKTPSAGVMRALLHEVGRTFPGAMLSLTGGEPTLRKSFLDEVELAARIAGIGSIQVQTNAVAFASKLEPAALPRDPRLSFFVSMHALDESTYDVCTGTRGQFALALAGLRRLVEAGHRVTVNCVVNSENLGHLPDYVRRLPELIPMADKVDLHFSTLICPETKPAAQGFLVRYPVLAARLRDVVAAAENSGVRVQSLRASTHAAMPACQLDDHERSRDPHRPHVLAHETGALHDNRPWVRAAACDACIERPHCLGVPRPYALRFGLDELRPIRK
ncbi:MAG: radical SAM protein [Myxococcota bacterium]